MRPASTKKDATHARIVDVASRAIRRSGYSGTGVADIMKEAGLTHGGFYAHFADRDALIAEAADRASEEALSELARVAASVPPKEAIRAILKSYLSKEHVHGTETGCPIAALGSEVPRQSPQVRQVATRRIAEMVELLARYWPTQSRTQARRDAMTTIATLLGTLVLARAVDDAELSESLISSSLRHLLESLP